MSDEAEAEPEQEEDDDTEKPSEDKDQAEAAAVPEEEAQEKVCIFQCIHSYFSVIGNNIFFVAVYK